MQKIEYEYVNCSICGNNYIDKVYTNNINESTLDGILPVTVNIGICKKCGFIFQYLVPTEKSLSRYYSRQSECNDESNFISKEYYETYDFIKENVEYNNINKVLDIGCRRGEILTLFKSDYKNVLGIEPSSSNVKYLREKAHIPVINEMFSNDILKGEQFDLIILTNVLEHMKNPRSVLKDIFKKISNNGYLFCSVPKIGACINKKFLNNISDFFSFQHLNYFTINNLLYFIKKLGYGVVKYRQTGESIQIICNKIKEEKIQLINEYKINNEIIKTYIRERHKSISKIINKIRNLESDGLIIYGAGTHTTQFLQLIDFSKLNIVGICDSDKNKYGIQIADFTICSIDEIDQIKFKDIIISSNEYQNEIYEYLIKKFPDKNIIKLYM
ncbi:class I SAM-dependent methyltransferase [Clostridium kluyveri]|uniref:Methyltransferase n=2 Tax=Clostridium kluyveri TaxID=1534 RepID=A5MZ22_CLOK5|nr:class I SAM-dependent methyltransferase [Clostridium kluyveri]EDK34118.1 Conserved hypothetical protein [Clostridium kluyveri DSM 555]BAH06896.1 hypothetical protein CKR_1845 [Clostridium kluyveri NBRC 12016]